MAGAVGFEPAGTWVCIAFLLIVASTCKPYENALRFRRAECNYLPKTKENTTLLGGVFFWQGHQDSNSGHAVLEAGSFGAKSPLFAGVLGLWVARATNFATIL